MDSGFRRNDDLVASRGEWTLRDSTGGGLWYRIRWLLVHAISLNQFSGHLHIIPYFLWRLKILAVTFFLTIIRKAVILLSL
jgi:hypothetical protein